MDEWFFKGEPFHSPSEDNYGFVYVITNLTNQKQYIGKKLFWHKKIKVLKGKKKRYLAESDWKSYFGSSPTLKEDVNLLGSVQFKREILYLCSSKSECSYFEAKEQFLRDVLFNSNLYYNDWISVRVTRRHLESRSGKTLQETKESI